MKVRFMAAGALLVTAIAGCSSSASHGGAISPNSAGGGTSAQTSAGGTSAQLKLMVIADLQSASYSNPEALTGAQAAVKEINDAGGFDGKKIDLSSCNSQADPNAATACGRKAVSEHISAVIGQIGNYSGNVDTVLQSANIPAVGTTDIAELDHTSPISFPLGSAPVLLFGVVPLMPGYLNCRHPASLATQVPASVKAANAVKKFYAKNVPAAAPVKIVNVDFAATDISSQVATLLSGGTDCVFPMGPPTINLAVMKDVYNSGQKVKISVAATTAKLPAMRQLGPAGQGVYAVSDVQLPGTSPAGTAFEKAMNAIDPKAPQDPVAGDAYTAVKIVTQVAKGLHDYSGPSILKALNQAKNISPGLIPPIPSWPAKSPVPGLARIANFNLYGYVMQGNNFKLLTPKGVNIQAQLTKLFS